jgi:hypothetical protein
MKELDRIKSYINGELPEAGTFGYFIVENIDNPEMELTIFKQVVTTLLENPDLDSLSPEWEKLLPKQFVEFIEQLEDDDYRKDQLLSNIPRIIDSFREVREWEWYSSEILENGFEVVFTGIDRNVLGTVLLHHQGLPFSCLFSEEGEDFYETKNFGVDVLSYKKYDRQLLKLK